VFQDTVSGVDSQSTVLVYTVTVQEAGQALDVFSNNGNFFLNISETSVITDTPSNIGQFFLNISETSVITDTPSNIGQFFLNVNESISITDSAFARYLWELVDDSQTTTWTLINTVD